ncbi:MAG: agmatine deiminase family protein [Pirellulales bacterium]
MNDLDRMPAELGYRFPAEWEPHAATWLAWPHNPATWPGKREAILPYFTQFVQTVAEVEPVHLLVGGEHVRAEAERWVGRHPQVVLHDIPTNDAWCRDHGPTFLVGPSHLPPALIDWGFNSWGEKYPPYDLDNQVPRRVAELLGWHRFDPRMVLEGGSIDGNGCGTLLTTETCLLNPRRNPGLSREQIVDRLRQYLGTRHVIWLGGEIEGDDTDGHIDQLARFVGPRRVLASREHRSDDANHGPLEENWRRLQQATDQDGEPLEVWELPMPAAKYYEDRRLPAGYANFYIANGLVVVPSYDDPADDVARDVLQRAFPDRRIVAIPSLDLVWGLGAFHCLSQQQPAPTPR